MNIRLLLVTLLVALLAGCATIDFNPDSVKGSGNVKTETRSVSGFSEVELLGSGALTIEQTSSESLTIEAEDNILPLLTSTVVGNRLTLSTKPNTSMMPTKPINYRLTVKDLRAITLAGSASVEGANLKLGSLRLLITGSGNIHLAGQTARQDVEISGSGVYRGEALDSREATVAVTGSGQAAVKVSDKLDVRLSGSGQVTYMGNPVVTQNVTGSGKVVKR